MQTSTPRPIDAQDTEHALGATGRTRPEWAVLLGGILLAIGIGTVSYNLLQVLFLATQSGAFGPGEWRTHLLVTRGYDTVRGAIQILAGVAAMRGAYSTRQWVVVIVILLAVGRAVEIGSQIWLGLPVGAPVQQIFYAVISLVWQLAMYVAILIFLWTGRRRIYFNPPVDYPQCEECGYNLTGTIEPRCPECGTPFDAEAAG